MATITRDAEWDALTSLVAPFLPELRPSVPYFGLATSRMPLTDVTLEGLVQLRAGAVIPGTAAETRAALLSRADELIAALHAAGWVLAAAPRLTFGGELERPVISVLGELFKPPREHGIELRAELRVLRVTLAG